MRVISPTAWAKSFGVEGGLALRERTTALVSLESIADSELLELLPASGAVGFPRSPNGSWARPGDTSTEPARSTALRDKVRMAGRKVGLIAMEIIGTFKLGSCVMMREGPLDRLKVYHVAHRFPNCPSWFIRESFPRMRLLVLAQNSGLPGESTSYRRIDGLIVQVAVASARIR